MMNTITARTGRPSPVITCLNSNPSPAPLAMLTPTHAWRLLCRRTGGVVSRTTFYRWLNSGRVGAIRLGARFLIPLPMLEDAIEKCLNCERI